MHLPIFIVDAFTGQRFMGNPAAVVLLDSWLPEATMQAIAAENNLSETAFLVAASADRFHLRWFSPLREIDFCGHATLASAHVLLSRGMAASPLVFATRQVGDLTVTLQDDGLIEMDFPDREPTPVAEVPSALVDGLSIRPREILVNAQAYVAIYADEDQVLAVVPDLTRLAGLDPLDVAVTAPGRQCDFVTRYFWPASGGDEDPVTGSIHAGLAPMWARRLGKSTLVARQLSRRGGVLYCRLEGGRVFVAGHAVRYLEGSIDI